ncbi:hypothetical protein GWK47_027694 [Chionoecetes opilio]|uniref:Uncharacterized protein n=1 Tax=Chionoecetes opilio TaxID=41210 RepID=A0A8J8WBU0_CHIOP|nr:hypothetical protein GWK47_027694 [Chionoecetes opilio]
MEAGSIGDMKLQLEDQFITFASAGYGPTLRQYHRSGHTSWQERLDTIGQNKLRTIYSKYRGLEHTAVSPGDGDCLGTMRIVNTIYITWVILMEEGHPSITVMIVFCPLLTVGTCLVECPSLADLRADVSNISCHRVADRHGAYLLPCIGREGSLRGTRQSIPHMRGLAFSTKEPTEKEKSNSCSSRAFHSPPMADPNKKTSTIVTIRGDDDVVII